MIWCHSAPPLFVIKASALFLVRYSIIVVCICLNICICMNTLLLCISKFDHYPIIPKWKFLQIENLRGQTRFDSNVYPYSTSDQSFMQ